MLVPVVVAASTSPSPANVPPVICTVALAILLLSASVIVTLVDRVNVLVGLLTIDEATPASVGASLTLTMLMVEVVLPVALLALPSLSVQVTVRVRNDPKSAGFSPALKVTVSSTA